MKIRSGKLTVLIAVAGVLLIVFAAGIMIFDGWSRNDAVKNAPKIVSDMYSLMPKVHDKVPLERADNGMTVIQLDGCDYVGIIEVPMFETALPVGAEWNKGVDEFPCRYTGSVYDRSLIIGGGDAGQLGFVKDISIGDAVIFTDTAGGRYAYTVSDIEKTDDVSLDNLTTVDADLVLFARDVYGFDYTVIGCKNGK